MPELHAVEVGVTSLRMTAAPTSQVPAKVKVPCTELVFAGLVKPTTGAVLSTVSAVPLGPAAALLFRAVSEITPAATLMVTDPSPLQLDKVTVRGKVPEPEIALLQLAVPVAVRAMFELRSDTLPTPTESAKVRTQDAVPVLLTTLGLTAPKEMVGRVLSLTTVRDTATLVLPARSVWLTEIDLFPSLSLNVTVAV